LGRELPLAEVEDRLVARFAELFGMTATEYKEAVNICLSEGG
jgi:hypothetical protein